MRIVIEIDGTPVVATDVSRDLASGGPQGAPGEPPPDLAAAARALGAFSAGSARFVGGADFATAGAFEADVPPAAPDLDADVDAGAAADAAARTAAAPRREVATKRKARRTKRG